MKLTYYDLLSPKPIKVPRVGSFISPFLKDLPSIDEYLMHLNMLLLSVPDYFTLTNLKDGECPLSLQPFPDRNPDKIPDRIPLESPGLSPDSMHIFDLITRHDTEIQTSVLKAVESALSFFMTDSVLFDEQYGVFLTYDGSVDEEQSPIPTGVIRRENYSEVCDIIARRNYIKREDSYDPARIRSKKAQQIYEKMMKGRQSKSKAAPSQQDSDLDLGNIISKVSSRHPSINLTNIYELTVYQLYDQFYNLINNSVFDIQGMALAVNGSKAVPGYQCTDWYKNAAGS